MGPSRPAFPTQRRSSAHKYGTNEHWKQRMKFKSLFIFQYFFQINITLATLQNAYRSRTQYCWCAGQNVTIKNVHRIAWMRFPNAPQTKNLAAETFPGCCCDVAAMRYRRLMTRFWRRSCWRIDRTSRSMDRRTHREPAASETTPDK